MLVKTRKGQEEYRADEHMRPDTTLEALAKLPPYFRKDGYVTAGNASGIGDGSASTVIAEPRIRRNMIRPPEGFHAGRAAAGTGLSPDLSRHDTTTPSR